MSLELRQMEEKLLVGKKMKMNLARNRTGELWASFLQERRKIPNTVGNVLYSLQFYDPVLDFHDFTPETFFEKWAAVEVSSSDDIPAGMELLILPRGLYAVFLYKGRASNAAATFQSIFHDRIPSAEYRPDNRRPHFELLGEKYKNEDPDSEEEIWVPVMRSV